MKKVNHGQRENPERTLHFLDLDQAKMAVLASLCSPGSRRCYEHAMVEFIDWYCSEPRLGFNKGVVTRYRMHLEARGLPACFVMSSSPKSEVRRTRPGCESVL